MKEEIKKEIKEEMKGKRCLDRCAYHPKVKNGVTMKVCIICGKPRKGDICDFGAVKKMISQGKKDELNSDLVPAWKKLRS